MTSSIDSECGREVHGTRRTRVIVALILCALALVAVAATVLFLRVPDANPQARQERGTIAAGTAEAIIQATIDKEGVAAARARFDDLLAHPERYTANERGLSTIGYRYAARKAWPEAIAVFEFAVRRFPDVYDTHYRLIEAYLQSGDPARAETVINAWTARQPQAEPIERRAAKSPAIATRDADERRVGFKPGQPTGIQGPYLGQTPPGTVPRVFAPGIVSRLDSGDYACTLSPDGTEFYFTRRGDGQNILVSRLGPGGWTFPEPVGFSAGANAHEPHVTHDNTRIFWGWFHAVPGAGAQEEPYGIFMAERTPRGWSKATYAGPGMAVSSTRDGRIFLTVDDRLAEVAVAGGRFGAPRTVHGGMDALLGTLTNGLAHPAVAPDGRYIVFDICGGSHLFVCFRQADGTWGEAIDLAAHGLPNQGGIASISPDGKYLFYEHEDDIYWVSTEILENLRPRTTGK